jgi:hypothetical protein
MHRCIPEPSSRKILEEAYLFFLAFFFAGILFSSHHSKISAELKRRSALSASMYSECEFACQEKSE